MNRSLRTLVPLQPAHDAGRRAACLSVAVRTTGRRPPVEVPRDARVILWLMQELPDVRPRTRRRIGVARAARGGLGVRMNKRDRLGFIVHGVLTGDGPRLAERVATRADGVRQRGRVVVSVV